MKRQSNNHKLVAQVIDMNPIEHIRSSDVKHVDHVEMWGCKQSMKQDLQGLHQGEAAIPLSYMAENVHTNNILRFQFQLKTYFAPMAI